MLGDKNMAKTISRPKAKTSKMAARGASATTSRVYPAAMPQAIPRRSQNLRARVVVPDLPLVDRRVFSFESPLEAPARRSSGRPARVIAPPLKKPLKTPSGVIYRGFSPSALLFDRPEGVKVCVQRGVRKEVMHASGKAGKGYKRPPVFNKYSKIRCK